MNAVPAEAAAAAADRLKITEIFLSLQGEAAQRRLADRVRAPDRLPAALPVLRHRLRLPRRRVADDRRRSWPKSPATACATSASPAASRWRRSAASRCCSALCDAGYEVSLETSGAIDIADGRSARVARGRHQDARLAGSRTATCWANLPLLTAHDQVKFVICDRADYDWARGIVAEHALTDALRRAVLAELRPGRAARAGRLDRRRPPAGALPDAAAQDAVERRAGR